MMRRHWCLDRYGSTCALAIDLLSVSPTVLFRRTSTSYYSAADSTSVTIGWGILGHLVIETHDAGDLCGAPKDFDISNVTIISGSHSRTLQKACYASALLRPLPPRPEQLLSARYTSPHSSEPTSC